MMYRRINFRSPGGFAREENVYAGDNGVLPPHYRLIRPPGPLSVQAVDVSVLPVTTDEYVRVILVGPEIEGRERRQWVEYHLASACLCSSTSDEECPCLPVVGRDICADCADTIFDGGRSGLCSTCHMERIATPREWKRRQDDRRRARDRQRRKLERQVQEQAALCKLVLLMDGDSFPIQCAGESLLVMMARHEVIMEAIAEYWSSGDGFDRIAV